MKENLSLYGNKLNWLNITLSQVMYWVNFLSCYSCQGPISRNMLYQYWKFYMVVLHLHKVE